MAVALVSRNSRMVRRGSQTVLIPNQLPQLVTAQRSSALQTLALQAGQVLDAKVLGPAPNGGTQVEIAGQKLNLLLPSLIKAGQSIKLEVQSTGPQVRLAIQPNQAPSPPGRPIAPASPAGAGPVARKPNAVTTPQATLAPPTTQAATAPVSSARAQIIASPPPAGTLPTGPAAQNVLSQPMAATPNRATVTSSPALPQSATVPSPVQSNGTRAPSSAAPAVALATQSQATAAQPFSLRVPTPGAPAPTAAGAQSPAAVPTPAPVVTVPLQGYPRSASGPQALAAPPQSSGASATTSATPTISPPVAASTSPPRIAGVAPQQVPPTTTPQAALTQMVQSSLPRQDAMTSLTSALVAIAGKVALPEQVMRAAQMVLSGQVNLDDGVDGKSLAKAVLRSGVFQEASIVRGGVPTAQSDMKSALLALRTTLASWLGQQAALIPAGRVTPPLRGAVPRVSRGDAPRIDPAAPVAEIGKHLLDRTEASLSRLRLHQNASLPDAAGRTSADWSMDIPVMIGPHQTMLQLQIHRDQHGNTEEGTDRGWQMRFALKVPELGEVGAQVSLRGANTGVMLWATNPSASAALEENVEDLRSALVSAGLHPGAVIVRHGEPPLPTASASGHLVDATR